MRKKLLSILLVLGALEMYAQVGVGTEYPNISSQLDVVAENKGILIPRVNLLNTKSQEPILSDGFLPNGLIVFNTSTSGEIPDNVDPGIYYWLNGEWKRVISPLDIRSSNGTVIYDPQAIALTYINQNGESRLIDINAIVKENETITTLVRNLDGSYTFTNEAGVAKRIDFNGDLVVEQLEHEVVLEKIESLVKQKETLTALTYNAATHTLNYKPERGEITSFDLKALVNNNETLTGLTYDTASHNLTYKAEDGNTTTIDLSTLLNGTETLTRLTYDSPSHTLTYNAEDGNTTTIDLSALVNDSQTLTTLGYDTATRALVYKAEDGNTTTIDLSSLIGAPETLTRLDYNHETQTLTYRAEDGNITTINLSVLGGGSPGLSALAYNPATQELTYKAEDGTVTTISLSTLVNTPETVTNLTYDNGTNALVYMDENGTENVINLPLHNDSLWSVSGATVSGETPNSRDIYQMGNVGFKTEAVRPTETIDVGSGNVRIREISEQNGEDDDRIVVANLEGVLRTVDRRDLGLSEVMMNTEIEPWQVIGGTAKARWNNQNIYQIGSVVIGHKELTTPNLLKLDVKGAIRTGQYHKGSVGICSAVFGNENTGSGKYSFVSGVNNNSDGLVGHIIGGERNAIDGSGYISTILASRDSRITKREGIIVGGQSNTINAEKSLIFGGRNCATEGEYGLVFGGLHSVAKSYMETVFGPHSLRYTAGSKNGWRSTDRLFVIGNGTNERNESNAVTVLKNGNTGFKKEAADPTETIDVGSGNVRIRDINRNEGAITDKLVAVTPTGVLKILSGNTLLSKLATAEPWQIMGGTAKAISNTNAIYQMGSVGIGTSTLVRNVMLNVNGAVRIGTNHTGNVGNASVAVGNANVASGANALVLGHNNSVSGDNSFATGYQNIVSGQGSLTVGHHNNVSGSSSIVVGSTNRAEAEASAIMGGTGCNVNARATGSGIVGGSQNIARGEYAAILGGTKGIAVGNYSTVLGGTNNQAGSYCETVLGANALTKNGSVSIWNPSDRLLVVGNGYSESSRSNAITVLKNGNTGFKKQAFNPTETIDVGSGNVRIRDINDVSGTESDKIVVVSNTGVLKTIDRSSLLAASTSGMRSSSLTRKQQELIEKQNSEIKSLKNKLQQIEEKLIRLETIIKNAANEE